MGSLATGLLDFVRSNLPAPPARLLEIGAGDGELARALAADGYDITAIDPEPRGPGVRPVALQELEAPAGSFDAAIAVTSLHHVEPLEPSLRHLADLLSPGAALVVDEFDVGAFDERAAAWWLEQRRALGGAPEKTAEELVREHRAHLHPLPTILAALEPDFDAGAPACGPYLYRWNLDASLRPEEEDVIARGEIPAVGARFVARRRS
ncbi:MAG TPA: class I SAM-dependent methyltransferase [Gaiellaceae bacterium]|nr:class I SAM-dependent methyltransferase [Gaiellaceae bacterium]